MFLYSKDTLYRHHREKGILEVITSLEIDRGLDFCQLNIDIVSYACTISEKKTVSTLSLPIIP